MTFVEKIEVILHGEFNSKSPSHIAEHILAAFRELVKETKPKPLNADDIDTLNEYEANLLKKLEEE